MKLTLILLVVVTLVASTLAKGPRNDPDKEALIQACKELGGGTKIRLEFDLGGACNGPCKKNKKRKAKKAPIEAPVAEEPAPTAPVAAITV